MVNFLRLVFVKFQILSQKNRKFTLPKFNSWLYSWNKCYWFKIWVKTFVWYLIIRNKFDIDEKLSPLFEKSAMFYENWNCEKNMKFTLPILQGCKRYIWHDYILICVLGYIPLVIKDLDNRFITRRVLGNQDVKCEIYVTEIYVTNYNMFDILSIMSVCCALLRLLVNISFLPFPQASVNVE